MEGAKACSTEECLNAVKSKYYRIPEMLCEVIAQAYINEKYLK